MEIPVMTSASTHGLRTAVSACAKPSNSYLTSSNYSGGCLKKIINTVKKSDSSPYVELTKKRKSTGDCGILCKKNKSNTSCAGQGFAARTRSGKLRNISIREEIPKKLAKSLLDSFPKNGELLSKIKSNDFFEREPTDDASTSTSLACGSRDVDKNDSNNNDKVNGSDFGAINNNVHNISIRKTDECVDDSELVNVEDSDREADGGWQVINRTTPISRSANSLVKDFGTSSSAVRGPDFPNIICWNRIAAGHVLDFRSAGESVEEKSVFDKQPPGYHQAGISQASPVTRQFGKNETHQQIRKTRKLSKTMCKNDVFLGGSCNPTTWRTDFAIPFLEKMDITYYNPQVSQWSPELLEVEYHAKENAAIMFFVVDNKTRGVSTVVEVAHIAGSRKNLILVIQSYTQENQTICGEVISQRECEDLRNGQEVLRDLVESQRIPVFDDIHVALECTEEQLRSCSNSHEINKIELSGLPQPKRIELREAFDAFVTTEDKVIPLKDACLVLQLITERRISVKDVAKIFDANDEEMCLEETTINFEQFSMLATKLKNVQDEQELYSFSKYMNDRHVPIVKDVFLGGTRTDTSWKEKIAVPLLKKHHLSYFNLRLSDWNDRFMPIEAAAMSSSYISLVVITNTARSIAEMAVASHYIGLGARMVLCIQHLSEETIISGDRLSENAVKDYNRGRMYLSDIAKRNGVKVFDDISDAVRCVIEECERR